MEISKSKLSKELKQIAKSETKDKKKKKIKGKVAKVLNKGRVNNYLMGINPYAQTLLDPFHVRGVKIPDIITTPSATFSITLRNTLTVNASGVCGLIWGYGVSGVFPVFTPLGGLVPYDNGLVSPGTYCVGCQLSPTATTAALLTGAVVDQQLPLYNSAASSVASLFSSTRLVSFGSTIEYIGSGLNAQGKITVASEPRQTFRDTSKVAAATLSLNDVLSLRSSQTASVTLEGASTAVYFPQDSQSTSYISTRTVYPNAQFTPLQAMGGEIYLIVDGAVSGQSFQVTSVWNFEGIPLLNQMDLIQTSVSKSDPIAESHAMNIVQSAPRVAPVNALRGSESSDSKQLTSALVQSDHPKQEKGMLESILDSIPDVVDKGLAVAEKVAPMVGTFLSMI